MVRAGQQRQVSRRQQRRIPKVVVPEVKPLETTTTGELQDTTSVEGKITSTQKDLEEIKKDLFKFRKQENIFRDIDIQRVKKNRELIALQEVRELQRQGFSISKSEINRFVKQSGQQGASSQRQQFQIKQLIKSRQKQVSKEIPKITKEVKPQTIVSGFFQGPTRSSTQEETFRQSGKVVKKFKGPIRPDASPEQIREFRKTGKITPTLEQLQSVKLEAKVIDTIKRDGKTIPLVKIVATQGRKQRPATPQEQLFFRQSQKAVAEFNPDIKGAEKIIFKTQRSVEARRQRGKGGIKEGATGFVQGVVVSGAGTALFLKELATKPVRTLGGIGKAIKDIPSSSKKVGRILRTDPSFATGFIVSEVLTAKGFGGIAKKLKVGKTISAKDIKKLDKATPELSIGLQQTKGGKDVLVIISQRKAGKLQTKTAVIFDVIRTKKGNFQIQRGRGIQQTSKEQLLFRDRDVLDTSKFTFTGKAKPTKARIIKGKLKTDLPKEIKTIKGEVEILGLEKEAELIKQQFVGFTKKGKGNLNFVVGKGIKKGRLPKDVIVFDPVTKKELVRLKASPKELKAVFKTKEIDNIGIIKKIDKKALKRILQKTPKKLEILLPDRIVKGKPTKFKPITPAKPTTQKIPTTTTKRVLKTKEASVVGLIVEETKLKSALKTAKGVKVKLKTPTKVIPISTKQLAQIQLLKTGKTAKGTIKVVRKKVKKGVKSVGVKQSIKVTQAQGRAVVQGFKQLQKLSTAQKKALTSLKAKTSTKVKLTKAKTKPVPKLSPQEAKLRKILANIKQKGQSVDIITGMKIAKERKISKRLAPNRAMKFAQKFVDKNIEASFRMKVNKKPPLKKDIGKFSLSKKFRPSKTNPLFLVEKRKWRLSHPLEKKQIKQARNSKKLKKRLLSFK